jgi:exodeoxyribonuclease VII small subunit
LTQDKQTGGGRRRKTTAAPPAELPFEQALARLEEIVEILEAGDAPLEKSLGLFEEGVALSRSCNGRLEAAERRLEVLVRKTGNDTVEPLDEAEFLSGPEAEPADTDE